MLIQNELWNLSSLSTSCCPLNHCDWVCTNCFHDLLLVCHNREVCIIDMFKLVVLVNLNKTLHETKLFLYITVEAT